MTQTTAKYPKYLSDFQALTQATATAGRPWVRQLREQAWSQFDQVGFPTARRGNERWKYTNVAPIARATFGFPLSLDPDTAIGTSDMADIALWQGGWTNLVFVDGRYSPALSTAAADNGIRVVNLAGASAGDGALVEKHLGQLAGIEDDGFTALNTAFLQDGALVHVPAGNSPSRVVHLMYLTTGREQAPVTHPRTLVVAGANSNLTLVEGYYSHTEAQHFTNAVTEIVVEDGARVDHYRLLLENVQSFHVGASRVYQGRDSAFNSVCFAKGAALGRNDFQVLLDAPGASCSLHGLYLTTGTQHMDNFINIDHTKPYGTSQLNYKGILDERSRAIFGGTVVVRKDAQKTDAHQTDKNLLLSEDAEVDSKPSLLIYADDVKCGHGATAGHIDHDTLFYMRSRGLDPETARRILIHAFASEIIDTVRVEPLRDYLDELFLEAIPATFTLGGA